MTREEAIYCLKSYQPDAPDDMCQKCKYYKSVKLAPNIYTCISSKARDMAIQALSQESSRDIEEIAEIMKCDADAETKLKMISNILSAKPHYFELSKEPKKWTIYTKPNETKYFECSKEVFKEIIKNDINKHKQKPCDKCAMKNSNSNYCENCTVAEYHGEKVSVPTKFVKQEPCDDVISRQAAIDAFERFIHELGIEDEPYNYGEMALSVKNVPPVTQKPIECDDTVSRDAILSKIKEVCFSKEWIQFRVDNGSRGQRDFLINYIEQLQTVTPTCEEREKGECPYYAG